MVVVREQYDIDRANLIGTEHRPHGFGKAIPATAIVVARAIESGVCEQPQTAEFEDHGRPPEDASAELGRIECRALHGIPPTFLMTGSSRQP